MIFVPCLPGTGQGSLSPRADHTAPRLRCGITLAVRACGRAARQQKRDQAGQYDSGSPPVQAGSLILVLITHGIVSFLKINQLVNTPVFYFRNWNR